MKKQAEFIYSDRQKSLVHLKKESVELSLTRCGYEECNAGYVSGPHKKSYYLLYAIVEGKSICELNGKKYPLEKNDVIIIYPEMEHCFKSGDTESFTYAWFGFAGMKAEECVIYSGFSRQNTIQQINRIEQVYRLVGQMIETRENTFSNILRRNGLLKIFFAELIDFHDRQFLEEQLRNVNDTEKSPHIREAITFINEHYADKIRINEIADYIGVNRSYLASSFKKMTGYSPKEYLLSLRMEKAKSLLEKTDIPVNAVAASVGYTDQLAFSRMFKEYTGISPKAFREQGTNKTL